MREDFPDVWADVWPVASFFSSRISAERERRLAEGKEIASLQQYPFHRRSVEWQDQNHQANNGQRDQPKSDRPDHLHRYIATTRLFEKASLGCKEDPQPAPV